MKSVIAAIAAIAASVVSAQTIVTSQPSTNQVLTAGTTTPIVWNPVAGTISTIDLRKGDASALTYVQNIASNVDASKGSYSWTIDASLAAGTDYALSFGQSPNVSYTPFFTINAASGNSSAAVSSVASSTSSVASVSSVAVTSSSVAPTTTSSVAASTTSAAASSVAASSSAAPATSHTSSANKNVAAVGVAAVAGAVVAALI